MKFDLTYATHEAHKCADYLSQVCGVAIQLYEYE